MKKNVMMRLAAILLVCVLASTCGISGTFAKYVTAGTAHDQARVAKWGVEFENSSSMFSQTYQYHDKSKNHYSSWTNSVSSGDLVVAPGTDGTAYKLNVTGTPEVSYIVEFDVDNTTLETVYLLKDDAGADVNYYPVQFTLTIGGHAVTITDRTTASLIDAIEGVAYFYEVTTNTYYCRIAKDAAWISCGSTAPQLNLSWEWEFEQGEDDLDTILGNLAVNADWYDATYDFKTVDYNLDIVADITATATQID